MLEIPATKCNRIELYLFDETPNNRKNRKKKRNSTNSFFVTYKIPKLTRIIRYISLSLFSTSTLFFFSSKRPFCSDTARFAA